MKVPGDAKAILSLSHEACSQREKSHFLKFKIKENAKPSNKDSNFITFLHYMSESS